MSDRRKEDFITVQGHSSLERNTIVVDEGSSFGATLQEKWRESRGDWKSRSVPQVSSHDAWKARSSQLDSGSAREKHGLLKLGATTTGRLETSHVTTESLHQKPEATPGIQLPQIGIISIAMEPAVFHDNSSGSLSARTPRSGPSHISRARRRLSERSQRAEALNLMVDNSPISAGDPRELEEPSSIPSRRQLFTPRARELAKQRVAKIYLSVQDRIPSFEHLKPPSAVGNRRKAIVQPTTRTDARGVTSSSGKESRPSTKGSRPSTSGQTSHDPDIYTYIHATTSATVSQASEHSDDSSPTSSAAAIEVYHTPQAGDANERYQELYPTPPASTKAKWMSWGDPLIPARQARRFRSRIIKEATPSNVRSVVEEAGLLTSSQRNVRRAEEEVDQELRRVAQLLTSQRPPNFEKPKHQPRRRATAPLEPVEEQAPYVMQTPSVMRTPSTKSTKSAKPAEDSSVNQVPWHIQTMAERAYQIEKERLAGAATGGNPNNLVSQHAVLFEGQMAALLDSSMQGAQWGRRGADGAQGGLRHLQDTMKQSLQRIPEYLQRIERGTQLMGDLVAEKNKEMLLEGQAHAEATRVMARLYANNFHVDGHTVDQSAEEKLDTLEMDEEVLDMVLANMYLEAARTSMADQPGPAKKAAPDAAAADRMTSTASAAQEESEHQVIHAADVIQHVDFHRDIAYIKYKTTVFKKTMRDRNFGPNVLDLSKQAVNPIVGGLHLADKKMHFLRVSFVEADHLPIMDVHKASKGDVYVRCSLWAGDRIVSGHKGEEIVTTRVAWNTNKPSWKDQEFEFIVPQTNDDVVLRVEVRDVDVSSYGQGSLDDHFIGELEFLILQEGTQIMVSELEYEEWYLLRNKDKSDVRHNLGVENSVLKGRGSVLRVRHIYTKKPRLSRSEYAKRIQGNLRCFFARRRTDEAKAQRKAMLARGTNTEELEGQLTIAKIWKDYTDECERQMTHPISKIKHQMTSSEITLNGYAVSYNGIVALGRALRDSCALGRLRHLSLQNMQIRGMGVVELVRAVNTSNNLLQVLKLDRNPLSLQPLAASNPNTNRLGRGTRAAIAVAALLNDTPSLTWLSLSKAELGDDGIEIIAAAVSKHEYLTSLDISDNNSTNNPGKMLESAVAVGKMLAETRSLLELDYSWNNLSLGSGQAFLGFQSGQPIEGQGMYANSSLRRLVVNNTAFLKSFSNCNALGRTIGRENCVLDFLDISYCDLTAFQNVEALASGIVANPALRILVMDGNYIGWEGYKAVMSRKGRKRCVSSFQKKADSAAKYPTAKGLAEVLEIYKSFDEDENGTMDRDEFAEILARLGFMKTGWTDKDVSVVFDKIDVDGSGQIDFSEFYEWYCEELSVGEDGETSMQVSMKNCNVNVKDANFDGTDPDGKYDMDMSLMRSRTILLALMKLVYNGKGEFVEGTVSRSVPRPGAPGEFDTTPFVIDTPPDISSWVIPRDGYLNFDFITSLTSKQASVFINLDELLELRSQLEDPNCTRQKRMALLDQHLTPGRLLSYHQALDLLKVYLVDTAASAQPINKELSLARAFSPMAPVAPVSKSQPGSTTTSPEPEEARGRSTTDDLTLDLRRRTLIRQGSGRAKGIDQEERFAFVARVFPILNASERDLRLLSHLENAERIRLEDRLGIIMHPFDAKNPTGYQRLRLNKVGERGLVLKLIEMCNEMTHEQASFLATNSHRTGGVRDPLSLVWRNARFNGRLFFFEKHWRVPHTGILELDFVDVRKPDPEAVARVSDKDYLALLGRLRSSKLSERDKVVEVRRATMDAYVTCLQVVGLLCELPLVHDTWRVELLVILFAKIVDWRGYRSLLFHLPVKAREALTQRIGKPMLFYDGVSSGVGHWKLDLSNTEERFIMQELLHRAHNEPGSKIMDCEYNGSAFDVPSTWLTLVPREGWINFFYSRDKSVMDVVRKEGGWYRGGGNTFRRTSSTGSGPRGEQAHVRRASSSSVPKVEAGAAKPPTPAKPPPPAKPPRKELHPASFPPKFYVPMLPEGYNGGREGLGGTWVYVEKVRLVKENLQRRVASLDAVFAALDEDAGGSLSRDEMSVGLTKNGVWLSPQDMDMLLDMLDVDKSGDVDLAEFKDFWENAPPLRLGDYQQESYWAVRGIRGRRYEELVPFYDIRGQYPKEEVRRYGLQEAAHAPWAHCS